MRSLAWLLLLSQIAWACHPECTWQCDDPVCPAVCGFVCQPRVCSIVCPYRRPCPIEPRFFNHCPPDQCESDECPACEILVEGLAEFCPFCNGTCEELECAWQCRKPDCPYPKCILQCEEPACQYQPPTPSGSGRLGLW
jgi:hypothetical protein